MFNSPEKFEQEKSLAKLLFQIHGIFLPAPVKLTKDSQLVTLYKVRHHHMKGAVDMTMSPLDLL